MNRTTVKNFANWARGYLKQQITARATQFGITQKKIIEPQPVSGGLLVAGQILNATEANQYQQLRLRLDELLQQQDNAKTPGEKLAKAVESLIDEIAYTWFNRLAALRFMEVNRYIGRVLSSSDPNLVDPDILRDAYSIAEMEELPGLNLATLTQWRKLASREPNPDGYIYRRMLLAQCEALSASVPTLFDKEKNYQALCLPINLLNQDSIIRRFVQDIAEEDWQDIEIVGWLYQFYISDRKDEIIGAKSKVEAEDIPAATQLFTPRWIVQYMVENSLGRLWLESHPESKLREKMPYFLEGGKLGDVGGESSVINSVETARETKKEPLLELLDQAEKTSLPLHSPNTSPILPQTPQELTVIDPACGSGHILVYAFDLLLEIYKEQGYLERDIPVLILTHNLYGLDIDERAVQLASFAVLMKARAVNSRILRKPPALNIMTVRSTRSQVLPPVAELNPEDWKPLLNAFEDADSLGSLITPPDFDADKLRKQLDDLEGSNPIFQESVIPLYNLISQAELLRNKYWVVVANPPYMGSGSFNEILKQFISNKYPSCKGDLFAPFLKKSLEMTLESGLISNINQHSWMFLSSYEKLRQEIINNCTISNMLHLGIGVFPELNSKVVQSTAFVISKLKPEFYQYQSIFVRLTDNYSDKWKQETLLKGENRYLNVNQKDFAKIPGSAIAYWVSDKILEIFEKSTSLGYVALPRKGMVTADNQRFIRCWYEVFFNKIGFRLSSREDSVKSGCKWFPYQKGGEFRNWYGNHDWIVDWENDGYGLLNMRSEGYKVGSTNHNLEYIFKSAIVWSKVTSSNPSFRYSAEGFLFDDASGVCIINEQENEKLILGLLCSKMNALFLSIINPTLNIQPGNMAVLPIKLCLSHEIDNM